MAGMVVQHNMNALNAYNRLNVNVNGLKKSSEKLSSGYRINRAGDDAAGLAISEKMRSQIRGLNQAKRNSQDGISMIQTFEGALQESHSILQRMKELAAESANGTYDNATDRAAIQLEFDQLNDELNQIADTDFNGTVVLNGGEMADGLKAVDGEFNYANKAGQISAENAELLANAQDAAQDKIDAAQKTFDSAKAAYNAMENRDLCLAGKATQWNEIDDNKYSANVADTLFGAATVRVDSTDKTLKEANVEEFNVQFEFDGTDWKIKADTAIDGEDVGSAAWFVDSNGEVNAVNIDATNIKDAKIVATATGGFTIDGGELGNAIFASNGAKAGDVVTLTFTNSASSSYAPTNIGMDEESFDDGVGLGKIPTLQLSETAKNSAAMDEEMVAALEKLNAADISMQYSKDKIVATISDDSLNITETEAGKYSISFTNSQGKEIELATMTTTKAHEASEIEAKSTSTAVAAATVSVANVNVTMDAKNIELTWNADGGVSGQWELNGVAFDFDADLIGGGFASGKTAADFVTTGTPAHGDKLTLTAPAKASATTAAVNFTVAYEKAEGTATLGTAATKTESKTLTYVEGLGWSADGKTAWAATGADFKVGGQNVDIANFVDGTAVDGDKLTLSATDGSKVITFSVKQNAASVGTVKFGVALDEGMYDPTSGKPTINTAISPDGNDSRAVDKAYANAKQALADAKAAYPNSIDDLDIEGVVSKSDAFDNSTAIMTYADNITLQTGARTKDSVNFTFNYNTDGTADMGDLKANLNCSAREDGLNTENLSLATQDDANYAIDQIDKAINKVSMVRASFGSIQNRLEHKIENITTTAENLTEAESTIRDTDMASEMMNYTKFNILQQAAQSMLAQANQQPQGILQLLG